MNGLRPLNRTCPGGERGRSTTEGEKGCAPEGLVEGGLLGNLQKPLRRRRQFDGRDAQAAAAGTFGRKVQRVAQLQVLEQAHLHTAVRAQKVVVVRASSAALGSGRLPASPPSHFRLLVAHWKRGRPAPHPPPDGGPPRAEGRGGRRPRSPGGPGSRPRRPRRAPGGCGG